MNTPTYLSLPTNTSPSIFAFGNPFNDHVINVDKEYLNNSNNDSNDDWKNNYEIFSLITSPQNNNACEKIKNLICSRRYDLISHYLEEFNNITLSELDKIEVTKIFTVAELLFFEAPTSIILQIINIRAQNKFNEENVTMCIKILKYLLDTSSGTSLDHNILVPLFEIVDVFYKYNSEIKMFNLLTNYITTSNVTDYLDLLKYIMFTYSSTYQGTITLFNDIVYDNNLLIKMLMILDCDNDTNLMINDRNKIIREIIISVISKKSGNLNIVDKNGNTVLTNCLQDYSIKKIMYLIELGCDPLIKNPITGESTMDLVQSRINRLKKENNTEYYYYKTVKAYFNLCNFKNTPKVNNQQINNNIENNNKQSPFKWFYANYCKPSNQ